MKIAYATTYEAKDLQHWSGLGTFIARALERQGLDVMYVTSDGLTVPLRLYSKLRNSLGRHRYLVDREPRLAKQRSRRLHDSLPPEIDLVFSPGTLPVAHFQSPPPFAFWADATFTAMVGFYPGFSRLARGTLRRGDEIERRAIQRCAAAIYASDWAAESALRDYDADKSKVHVVPFGANMENLPTEAAAHELIATRPRDRCRLLFVGVEWERKGGPVAVETTRLLNARGLPTELTIVGCTPRVSEEFVRVVGFIDKARAPECLSAHFARSHFLILPARAECYGLVFAEASAFGVPSLVTCVGGVPTAVHSGANGQLFDVAAEPHRYADFVEATMPEYDNLARATVREYHRRLNWNVAGAAVCRILESVVA